MKPLRALGLLLGVGLLLAGCGGGSTSSGAGSTTTPASVTTPSTTPTSTSLPPADPAKVAKAKAAVLQQADFPAGWTAHEGAPHPHPQGEGDGLDLELVWQDITRCLGLPAAGRSTVTATSPTYLRDLATQGQSTVEYTDAASATATATALTGPTAQQCIKDAFVPDLQRNAPQGGTPGPLTVASLDTPQAGQKMVALRINASVNLSDLQVPLSQDFLVIFNGETVVRMLFLNPGGPFPQELERSLVQKVVGRA